ncbi:MAG: class II glutamine amidotransferase [Rhodobacter sp.]|uniref:class II glutamine amidotransferase n=1 Tax=Pararhodobacter sp. TaxID=2127056 RepID=UPI001DE065F2|nr:class II glutamine amidotransferase [Pararhodobacter sp.]MCB1344807.1 class II glutamine amidotransferase [Paracoccaceae bacterium]MCB2132036.1 class II glutamine amidotransferase [Paracoccaceae bacterium]MCC0073526.1 class II glutamine amidotransferase [Rhodobacter sp.]HPD91825.1 class II glutamine amidotransferase [Pararhodobacter sp.]
MCRWAAYSGAPIFLEEIVSRPGHSLIRQSHCATQCSSAINADGFGIAWYGERPEPGLYRDIYPAWSDPNLRSITAQVRSGLFLAHVRASTGTATSRNNCHPFVVGRWSFMHNGQVGGYDGFRRDADMMIPEDLYAQRKGATDSEALFLIALAEGLQDDPQGALERAAGRLMALSRAKGAAPHLRLTAAFSDGETLYAVRYASDAAAPSLWHRWSDSRGGRAVVSEPLEADETDWQAVPQGSFCAFRGEAFEIRPFDPEARALAA